MNIEFIATFFFAIAILHTFSISFFQNIALRFPEGSMGENFFHLLGEVEIIFGLWAGVFLTYMAITEGSHEAIQYIESRNFTEPLFVFVIMTLCATRPILVLAEKLIHTFAKILPLHRSIAFYWSVLVIGPILGSFITEPAAITVTALILYEYFYKKKLSRKLMYATLGLLLVNISIGGTLTPYAAPPVLMVAQKWNWDLAFMLQHFGWKAILALLVSTSCIAYFFRNELKNISLDSEENSLRKKIPFGISLTHLGFLFLIVATSHHIAIFIGLFLFFLGLVTVTKEYQEELKIKEGLLVAFFLGGLVTLGGMQSWWITPLLTKLSTFPLYVGAITLTSFTDNAALTYLGSLVENLSDISKYALVSGSVVGGGLTVIANAPNPAGFGILNPAFGEEGINPLSLFLYALFPTVVAGCCFWFLT